MPPKPNYSFEKRQRELEKKKKKEEKAQRKAAGPAGVDTASEMGDVGDGSQTAIADGASVDASAN